MKYYSLIYPFISILSFLCIFAFPNGVIVFLFISFLTLLRYAEDSSRDRVSDIIGLIFIVLALGFYTTRFIYYLPIVLIPVAILFWVRRHFLKPCFSSLLAPLPATILIAGLIIFSTGFRETLITQTTAYINNLVSQIGDGAARLEAKGIFAYFLTNTAKSAKIFINFIPCMVFVMISIYIYIVDKIKPLFLSKNFILIRDFRLPDFFVWILILIGIILLFGNYYLKFICYNILVIFGALYFLQGIQLLGIFFDKIGLLRLIRMIIYVFIAIEPYLVLIILLLGLFSVWFRPKIFMRTSKDGEKKDGIR